MQPRCVSNGSCENRDPYPTGIIEVSNRTCSKNCRYRDTKYFPIRWMIEKSSFLLTFFFLFLFTYSYRVGAQSTSLIPDTYNLQRDHHVISPEREKYSSSFLQASGVEKLPWQADFTGYSSTLPSPPWQGHLQAVYVSNGELVLSSIRNRGHNGIVEVAVPITLSSAMTWHVRFRPFFTPSSATKKERTFRLFLAQLPPTSTGVQRRIALEIAPNGKIILSALQVTCEGSDGTLKVIEQKPLIRDLIEYPNGQGSEIDIRVTLDTTQGWRLWIKHAYQERFSNCGYNNTTEFLPDLSSGKDELRLQFIAPMGRNVSNRSVRVSFLRIEEGIHPPGKEGPEPNPPFPSPTPKPNPSNTTDLLLNEVYADPGKRGAEYIELINVGHTSIDLSEFEIALKRNKGTLRWHQLSLRPLLLHPGHCLALSRHPKAVCDWFQTPSDSICLMTQLPQLVNQGFTLLLRRCSDEKLIDQVDYSPDLLASSPAPHRHIALERYRLIPLASASSAWLPALSTYNYGTPGRANSIIRSGGGNFPTPDPGQNIPNLHPERLHITELMPYPQVNGSEFIELFNEDTIPAPLHLFGIALRKEGHKGKVIPLSPKKESWLPPGTYRAFAPDHRHFASLYGLPVNSVNEVPSFPSLTNREGSILLVYLPADSVVEQISYFPEQCKERGRSLERINPFGRASESSNWAPTLSQLGATPSAPNSYMNIDESASRRSESNDRYLLPIELLASKVLTAAPITSALISQFYSLQGSRIALLGYESTLRWCRSFAQGDRSLPFFLSCTHTPILVYVEFDLADGTQHSYQALLWP